MHSKVALVTGGTSGIGAATAHAFATEGARVVITGRREREGAAVVDSIKKNGGEALFVRTDVTRESDVAAMVQATLKSFGRLDYAFNNAGIEGTAGVPTHEQTIENYTALMNTNVLGVLLSMKHEIPAMLKTGGGAIVNCSSVAGHIGLAGFGVYVATKHAVLGLTKCAALEYATQGIRVNAVSPGGVATDMLDRLAGQAGADVVASIRSLHPMGRIGRSEEIAAGVVWLCSDKASFMTGQSLTLDGGLTVP